MTGFTALRNLFSGKHCGNKKIAISLLEQSASFCSLDWVFHLNGQPIIATIVWNVTYHLTDANSPAIRLTWLWQMWCIVEAGCLCKLMCLARQSVNDKHSQLMASKWHVNGWLHGSQLTAPEHEGENFTKPWSVCLQTPDMAHIVIMRT